MAADVHQPSGMRELAPLERRGHALIGGAGQDEKIDDRRRRQRRSGACARTRASLGFGLREPVLLDARVELRAGQAEQLGGARLVVARLRQRLDDQRALDRLEVDAAGREAAPAPAVRRAAAGCRGEVTGRCSLRM